MKTPWIVGAAICMILALVGFDANIRQVRSGNGLPADPSARQAYVAGMFAVPTTMLVAGLALLGVGLKRRRRDDRKAEGSEEM